MFKKVLATILFISPLTTWAAATVGQVISADPEVSAQRNGHNETLLRKSNIYEGDILVTGSTSFAEIRFKDGAIIDLQPATRFEVAAYKFDPNNTKHPVKSDLRLLEGGFKTITGVITKLDPKSYSVQTDIATMGVRGTYWGSVACPSTGEYLGMQCKPYSVVMSVWADPEHKKDPAHCGAWIHNKVDYKELGPCQVCKHVYVESATSPIRCIEQSRLFLPIAAGSPGYKSPEDNTGAPIPGPPDQIKFYNSPADLGVVPHTPGGKP
jgi:hypothetical protein